MPSGLRRNHHGEGSKTQQSRDQEAEEAEAQAECAGLLLRLAAGQSIRTGPQEVARAKRDICPGQIGRCGVPIADVWSEPCASFRHGRAWPGQPPLGLVRRKSWMPVPSTGMT